MKVALVNLHQSAFKQMPPLGLMYLASCLRNEEKIQTVLLDMAIDIHRSDSVESVASCIIAENPDILCFTTLTEQHSFVAKLISRCKLITDKRIRVIVGGPHATLASESCARTLGAEVVFRGPGESQFRDLVVSLGDGLDRVGVCQDECRIISAPLSKPDDLVLSELSPDRRCIDLNAYQYPFTIMTARGCPGRCVFCSSPAINNGLVYIRSLDSIESEVDYLIGDYKATRIAILDDSFTHASGRLKALCKCLGEKRLHWFCESRLDSVDHLKLQIMKEAGCSEIQFGVESFEQATLDRIGKNIIAADIPRTLEHAIDLGIRVAISLMIGLPGDTVDIVRKRIGKAANLADKGVSVIEFGFLRPFPGTEIYRRAGDLGYGNISNWWEQGNEYPLCFPNSSMTRSELIGMMMFAVHKIDEALGTSNGS